MQSPIIMPPTNKMPNPTPTRGMRAPLTFSISLSDRVRISESAVAVMVLLISILHFPSTAHHEQPDVCSVTVRPEDDVIGVTDVRYSQSLWASVRRFQLATAPCVALKSPPGRC